MDNQLPEKTFQGFVPPVDDYFRMPNEWINICAAIKSLAELKIVQYVLRHTWGYQDYDGVRKLTLDEFMYGRKRKDGTRIDKGTGLSDRGVKDGIALAMKHGYLVCEIDDRDKARIKKSYGIKMISELPDRKILPPNKNLGGKNSPIPDRKNLPPDRKNLPSKWEDSSQRSEKDTKERYLKKNIEKDSKRSRSHPPIHSLPSPQEISFSSSKTEDMILTEEEQHVYNLACQRFFVAQPPEITPMVKEHCAKIAKAGIATLEQMKELECVARQEQRLGNKPIYLGNLARGLNGWLQTQRLAEMSITSKAGIVTSSYDDEDYVDDTFYPVREEVTHAAY